jgi:RsiW-degrading membrane proteinase PrsW (M82 family)
VYLTDEFDEPVDGIVYGVAACLGVATALNVHFVVETGGVLPVAGATHIANTAAGLVAAGAILGYGLGKRRFDPKHGGLWLTGAFLLAAVVVGGIEQIALAAGVRHGSFNPWSSLGAALGTVAAVLLGCHFLTARMRRQTLLESQAETR